MVDLQVWIVVQSREDGCCDPDGGSNHLSGKLVGAGGAGHHARQTYAIGFNTVVRNAKKAAGLFIVIHCLCIVML